MANDNHGMEVVARVVTENLRDGRKARVIRATDETIGKSAPWIVTTHDGTELVTLSSALAAIERARAEEREMCAKVCEEIAGKHLNSGRYVSFVADHSVRAGGQVDGAEECAAAIRSGKP